MAKDNGIPKSQCIDRRLYFIRSRNLSFGAYRVETGGFMGLRTKFGDTFVFEEYHYDNGPPYGTVTPIQELTEDLPSEIQLKASLGNICSNCKKNAEYVLWPEGGEREVTLSSGRIAAVPGVWKHIKETSCTDIRACSVYNRALHDWLEAMEKKYGHLDGSDIE